MASLQGKNYKGWKLYIDTCSLYNSVTKYQDTPELKTDFWDWFVPFLQTNDIKFTLTEAVISELKLHRNSEKKSEALKQIEQYVENELHKHRKLEDGGTGLMTLVKSCKGIDGDTAIILKIDERKTKFDQIYITNDTDNAVQVRRSFYGVTSGHSTSDANLKKFYKKLEVYKIGKRGDLIKYPPDEKIAKVIHCKGDCKEKYFVKYLEYERLLDSGKMTKNGNNIVSKKCYTGEDFTDQELSSAPKKKETNSLEQRAEYKKIYSTRDKYQNELNNIKFVKELEKIPKTGDRVLAYTKTTTNELELGKCISNSTGEGKIYDLGGGYIAKIYKKKSLNELTFNKIKDMINDRVLNSPYIALPQEIITDLNNNFIGFTMQKLGGITLSDFLAPPQDRFLEIHPNIKRLDLVNICKDFLKRVKLMHSKNILIGDLQPRNILVNQNENGQWIVSIIDCDSFQYNDKYPCLVMSPQYRPPEFHQATPEFIEAQSELFTVAKILFEILMKGQTPYAFIGCKDPVADMINGEFRYAFEFRGGSPDDERKRQGNKNAPAGLYKYQWSNLSKDLKDSFGNTFHRNGLYFEHGDRLSLDKWSDCLSKYGFDLSKRSRENAEISMNDIFPTDFQQAISSCGKCGEHREGRYLTDYKTKLRTFVCKDCWTPVSCPQCKWDGKDRYGDNKFFKWMADANDGICRKCAKEKRKNDKATMPVTYNYFSCPNCEKVYNDQTYLTIHLESHNEEVPPPLKNESWLNKFFRL